LIFIADEKEDEKLTVTPEKQLPSFRYEADFVVKKEGDVFFVEGQKIIKLVNQYDLNNPQALEYFQKMLKNLGVEKVLKKKGILEGDRVKIGKKDFYFYA